MISSEIQRQRFSTLLSFCCVASVIPLGRHPDYGRHRNGGGIRVFPSCGGFPASRGGGIGATLVCSVDANPHGHSVFDHGALAPGGRLSDACYADTADGMRRSSRFGRIAPRNPVGAHGGVRVPACGRSQRHSAELSLRPGSE